MSISAYRTIVLGSQPDDIAIVPQVLRWNHADVSTNLDWSLDVSMPLASVGDTIRDVSWSLAPSGQGERKVLALVVSDDSIVTGQLFGGVAGRNYKNRLIVTGFSQRVWTWQINQFVTPIPREYPLPNPPSLGFGLDLCAMNQTSPLWAEGQQTMFGAILGLPPITVEATGTTQITAAPVSLGKVLVNSATAAGAGILLPEASTFCGNILPVVNVSGVPINIYPFAGDTIGTHSVNAPISIEDQSSANFWVAESGLLIVS
jgi:hypothetical protein